MDKDIFPEGLDLRDEPPYGQLYGSKGPTYGDLLERMAKANQVGDTDYLIEGDIMQGIAKKDPEER